MTKTDQAKNKLRKHLIRLINEKWILPLRLVDEKVYYSKEVFPFLKQYGIVNEFGLLIEGATVDVEKIIEMLPDFKKKPVKQISPRRARSIGETMRKTLQDAIDQNVTSTMPLLEIEPEVKEDYYSSRIRLASDEQLFDELKARGWSGELTKTSKLF